MAFRCLSRAARAPLLAFTDSMVAQGRGALLRQSPGVRCAGVRRLSIFGSSDEQNASSDDSKVQVHRGEIRPAALRRSGGWRRSPARRNSFLDLWDPMIGTRSLRQMMNTMERLFEDPLVGIHPGSIALDFRAPWEVKEDEDVFRLRFDMPGLSKEEVKVFIEDGDLVIKGEHKAEDQKESAEDGSSARSSSSSYGSYYTRMKLPETVKTEEVKAELKHGVLQIVVPKFKEAPKKTVLDINIEE